MSTQTNTRLINNYELTVLKRLKQLSNRNNFNPCLDQYGHYRFKRETVEQNLYMFEFAKGCKILNIRSKDELINMIALYNTELFTTIAADLSENFTNQNRPNLYTSHYRFYETLLNFNQKFKIFTQKDEQIKNIIKSGKILPFIKKVDFNLKDWIYTEYGFINIYTRSILLFNTNKNIYRFTKVKELATDEHAISLMEFVGFDGCTYIIANVLGYTSMKFVRWQKDSQLILFEDIPDNVAKKRKDKDGNPIPKKEIRVKPNKWTFSPYYSTFRKPNSYAIDYKRKHFGDILRIRNEWRECVQFINFNDVATI